MTLHTRLNKLEGRLCDRTTKHLVDRERFDAVVARVLKACDIGQNMGLPQLSVPEARAWAKRHLEHNLAFGGFEFDVDEIISQ